VQYSCALEYYLMNSFIDTPAAATVTSPRPFLAWIDGKVTFVAGQPEYRDGIAWMKKLYDEGLIDPGNFTQNNEAMQRLCRKDPLLVGGYTADHVGLGVDFWANPTVTDNFHALPPVAGPKGVRYQPYWDPVSQITGFSFVIFNKCKNPAATYRFADFLLSEYNVFVSSYGVEGIAWNQPKDPNAKNIAGGPLKCASVILPADATQADKDRISSNYFWPALVGDIRERREFFTPAATPQTLRTDYGTRLEVETLRTEQYWPKVVLPRSLFVERAAGEEFADLKVNLVNHVLKNTAMFITGARSLSEWDAYLAELKRFGVDRYLEIYAKAYGQYQANLKK
jgi:putative aldouronate transport system substrate-binding protein